MSNQNLSRAEAAERSRLITVRSYDVELDLSTAPDLSEPAFRSRTTIHFECAEPGAATFLDFIHGGVRSVELNGAPLPVDQVVDGSRIHLPGLAAVNTVTVDGAALYSRSGEGMHRFQDPADGQVYLYTQYEPADARRVFADFEQPDLKASFTFHVTAPGDWQIRANAPETARTPAPGGMVRVDFAPTERISTYITSVLAGPYHREDSLWRQDRADGGGLEVPLAVFCRASLAGHLDADAIFDVTRRGLDFFHDLFDYPYPFGKYDQAFVPEYNLGAMENPGLVTFTEAYVFRSQATEAQYERRANTILHEMAHMWFGDLVTMRWWDDLWLKESFADFMGALAVDEATDFTASWVSFANRRKAWAYVQDQLPTTHPITADIPDLEAAKQNFDGITYAKGASVLKQLVAYVGFEAFRDAARAYFRRHAFGNTTLADLLQALEDSSGRDMGAWARLWLQTAGVPVLAMELETGDDGVLTRAVIRQEAVDPVSGRQVHRPHRMRVGLYDAGPDGMLQRTGLIELDVDGPETDVPELVGRRRPEFVLPNDGDLTYASVRFDPDSQQAFLAAPERLADPLARAVTLSALWNATRDGLLPPAAYVRMALAAAAAESGSGVLQVLLDNARHAVARFVPAEERGTLRGELYDGVVRLLREAAPGSDRQLILARAAAALGRSSRAHDGLLTELLQDAAAAVPGLPMAAELRWLLLQALAAGGAVERPELDAELERDRTAAGRVGWTTAMAARPTEAAKAEAWQQAVAADGLSNELLSAVLEGFSIGDRSLRQAWTEPYFTSLEAFWREHSIELASRLVHGLFPGDQDLPAEQEPEEHPVARRTAAWLAENPDAPQALRRIVIEEQDQLLRALRVQQAARRR